MNQWKSHVKWLWALPDGIFALGFLLASYTTVSWISRLSAAEITKLPPDVIMESRLSVVIRAIIPEPGWCLGSGFILLAAAYARISFVDGGSLAGRVFRWSCGLLFILSLVVAAPLRDILTPVPSLPNMFWMDEVGFLMFGVLICSLSFVLTKRKQ